MHFGRGSSWQRPHDAAFSSRAPSVAREHPGPGRAIRLEPQDGRQVAIQEAWTKDPSPFKINPHQLIPRPNK